MEHPRRTGTAVFSEAVSYSLIPELQPQSSEVTPTDPDAPVVLSDLMTMQDLHQQLPVALPARPEANYEFSLSETLQNPFRIGLFAYPLRATEEPQDDGPDSRGEEETAEAADGRFRPAVSFHDIDAAQAYAGLTPQLEFSLHDSNGKLLASRETLPDQSTAIIDLSTTHTLELTAHSSPQGGPFVATDTEFSLSLDGKDPLKVAVPGDQSLTEDDIRQLTLDDLAEKISVAIAEAVPTNAPPIEVEVVNNRLVVRVRLDDTTDIETISIRGGAEFGFQQVSGEDSMIWRSSRSSRRSVSRPSQPARIGCVSAWSIRPTRKTSDSSWSPARRRMRSCCRSIGSGLRS